MKFLKGEPQRAYVLEIREGITDLVHEDSTVAIASGDVTEDYYLLKVLSDGPEILENRVKDDWNAQYPVCAKVVSGYFYERVTFPSSSPNLYYKLIDHKSRMFMWQQSGLFVLIYENVSQVEQRSLSS